MSDDDFDPAVFWGVNGFLGFSLCDDSFSNHGALQLPRTKHNKQVPNCCAICLGDCRLGNVAIWSSNPFCQHASHDECIFEWLSKMQPATLRPRCRQELTDLMQRHRRTQKVIWTGTNASHLRSIGS